MTTSQKVGLPIVIGAVVFLLAAAFGVLQGLMILATLIARLAVLSGIAFAVQSTEKPKRKGQ